MTKEVIKIEDYQQLTAKDYQNILINKDLASLPIDKQTSFMLQSCEHLGINPLVRPFEILKFQGKAVLYLTASGCENLASQFSISFKILKKEIDHVSGTASIEIEGTIPAMNGKPERKDVSTAYITIGSHSLKDQTFTTLKGLDFANAMMKLETKARRRLIIRMAGIRDEVYETEETINPQLVDSVVETKESKVSHVKVTKATSTIVESETVAPVIELYDNNNKEHKNILIAIMGEIGLDLKGNEQDRVTAKELAKMCIDEKVPLDKTILKAFIQTKLVKE